MPSQIQCDKDAPGRPGIKPRWTSSAKSGAGADAQPASLIRGQPRDTACLRDVGFMVIDGEEFTLAPDFDSTAIGAVGYDESDPFARRRRKSFSEFASSQNKKTHA